VRVRRRDVDETPASLALQFRGGGVATLLRRRLRDLGAELSINFSERVTERYVPGARPSGHSFGKSALGNLVAQWLDHSLPNTRVSNPGVRRSSYRRRRPRAHLHRPDAGPVCRAACGPDASVPCAARGGDPTTLANAKPPQAGALPGLWLRSSSDAQPLPRMRYNIAAGEKTGWMKEPSHAEPQRRREINALDCVLCASASLREL
jgi:hypothetical protein